MMPSQGAQTPGSAQIANFPDAGVQRNIRRLVWMLGVIGVALICFFDLGPALAFNDDWIYAWDVRHFDLFHIHLYPYGSALAMTQIVWAWLLTLGHADQRLLRLTVVPFVLLVMYALHQLAKLAGANKTWAAIAAIAPLSFPIFAANATTFMSDLPYVALLLIATLGAARWQQGRRWIALCVVFAILATLQRQVGATIPLAVTLVLFLRRGELKLNPDLVGIVLLWTGCLAVVFVPSLTGLAPATGGSVLASALSPNPIYFVVDLLFLPGIAGLGLMAFLIGLVLGRKGAQKDRTKLLIFAIVLLEGLLFLRVGTLFPGDVFSSLGFNITVPSIGGHVTNKALPLAIPLYIGLETLALLAFIAFIWRWRNWWTSQSGSTGLLLLVLATVQFLPLALLPYLAIDRYYIPIVLLLLPLAAKAANQTTRPVLASGLALALMAAGVLTYAIEEQDYQAWQLARDRAACLAYQYVSPIDVQAGYEANAVYVEVPHYDRTGTILGGIPTAVKVKNFSTVGPDDPIIRLVTSGPNDPRPGYNYSSLVTQGKVVLVTGPHGAGLDIRVPDTAPHCP